MMTREEICSEFKIDSFDGAIAYAVYEQESYEGSAAVIYIADGKLFMVSGSHCSCNGLEECWDPSEVTVGMLKRLAENGWGTDKRAAQHVLDLLEKLDEPDPRALEAALVMQSL